MKNRYQACAAFLLTTTVPAAWSFTATSHTISNRRIFEKSTIVAGRHHQSSSSLFMANNNNNLLDSLTSFLPNGATTTSSIPRTSNKNNIAIDFLEALNQGNVDAALSLVADSEDCVWDECTFYERCVGKEAIERRLRLQLATQQQQLYVVDEVALDNVRQTIGVLFHKKSKDDGVTIPNSRGCAMFQLDSANLISKVCIVVEPATRGGEAGLQILSQASKVMKVTGYNPEAIQQQQQSTKRESVISTGSLSPPEQYFDAWNRRDMDAAVDVFSENTRYEDTAFEEPFVGKEVLKAHLFKCANAFPPSFQIVIDAVAVDSTNSKSATVEWHFENGEGEALPFTQGVSFYRLDQTGKKIVEGTDFIEPAVIKPSGINLLMDSIQTQLSQEPLRWIPLVSWLAYAYIVFFSDGILPGANALVLEQRTWEEVLNLSLNFFLVSPLLNLPFSPSVHPMLEGVFNLLLSWAAMFAGFLSDDRRRKPNLTPMLPIVAGMQFLTSAFLLPYLAFRSTETDDNVTLEELPVAARVAGENPILGGLMGLVGSGSILWFFLGRAEEYGAELSVRLSSFGDLLSIDRVGSSFLVDLAIFALFQGWLVEDDLKRRGALGQAKALEIIAKCVPFFGLATYLMLRPKLPETRNESEGN